MGELWMVFMGDSESTTSLEMANSTQLEHTKGDMARFLAIGLHRGATERNARAAIFENMVTRFVLSATK